MAIHILTLAFALLSGALFFSERLQWMEAARMVWVLAGAWWVSLLQAALPV